MAARSSSPTPAPAGAKGIFGTYDVTQPAFEGYADLRFLIPAAILADRGTTAAMTSPSTGLKESPGQKITTYYLVFVTAA